jgi:hypothetical protein
MRRGSGISGMKRRLTRPAAPTFRSALVALLLVTTGGPASGEVVDARGLRIEVPDGWRSEPSASSMRAAQMVVPGSAGDGQLTVFHFGPGGGGGVEANFERWLSQVELPAGVKPHRETFESQALTIHFVDAAGKVMASRVGSFPAQDQPGWRLFGAVIEGEGGPWYLRLVGPDATLAEQRDEFLAMLRGAALQ